MGSFAVYQGIDLLFSAIPRVIKANAQARFAIIGGSAAEIECRKQELARVGVGNAVQFLGLIPPDDLPNYLAAADILLSPRIAGANTPLKLLDYLKAGRAIVATDTPANRLLLDEHTAELCAPNAEAFAAAILRLAADPSRRGALAQAGARLVRDQYHFAEFARRLVACYDTVLSRVNPPAR